MISKLAARGMQRSWTSKSKNTKEVLHNSSIKGKRMLSPGSVVFAFEIWIGLVWFVAFLLFSVAPIKFQREREWSEVVARLHYISLCIGVIVGFAANFLQAREDKAIMKPNGRRILPEISLYRAMWVPGFLPLRLLIYSHT